MRRHDAASILANSALNTINICRCRSFVVMKLGLMEDEFGILRLIGLMMDYCLDSALGA
jgi:hypothetical protein